jgi:hypothetical protein
MNGWHGLCEGGPWRRSRTSERLKGTVVIVLTCDYNGWNDAPEEEREWFDQHPEVWNGSTRAPDPRPLRATPRPSVRHFRGGMAA